MARSLAVCVHPVAATKSARCERADALCLLGAEASRPSETTAEPKEFSLAETSNGWGYGR